MSGPDAAAVTELHPADPVSGLPERSELGLRTRAVVEASALADVGLRTLAASMVTASMVPLALSRSRLRAERASMDLYGELADGGDVARSFPAPDGPHEVRCRRVRALPLRGQQGTVELLTFESRFQTVNPAMRDGYAAHRRNRIGRAQHWCHDPGEGPRPTLCVIHGFTASPYWVNSAFFSLPWFFYNGYDVLLYTLPFHGRRQSRRSPYSGHGYFAHGFATLNEAMAHAVHDFRMLVDHLLATSASRVGVTGLSLGGYTSALLAAVEERLAVVIPNAAVTDLGSLIHSWHPASSVLSLARAEVAELTDALLGHFVDQARRAGCSWSQIGDALGVSEQAAQQRHTARGVPAERLTDRTRLALERGVDAAQQAGAEEADTVHVLLGLLAVPECLAAKLLVEQGCTPDRVVAELGGGPVPGATPGTRLPGYTAAAARTLRGALEQALRLGHNHFGTEHLLLALADDPESEVGGWLAAAGATHAALRARVQEVLGSLAG